MKITVFQASIVLKLDGTSGKWRPDLAGIVGSPTTTIYDHLIKLKKKGLVRSSIDHKEREGRPRTLWFLTDLGKQALIVLKKGMEKNV